MQFLFFFSVMFFSHEMRGMKRVAELKPECAWLILLSGADRSVLGFRSELVAPVLILAVCGLFVLSLQCCSMNISSSALRQRLRWGKNISSVGGPARVRASLIGLSCQSY